MRSLTHYFLTLCLLLILSPSARSDTLDEFITDQIQQRQIPSLSLAIIQDGKIVKAQGYGVTEKGGRTPVTASTLFQAGSISKPLAALGALRLVQQGRLSLDEDVNFKLKTWKVPENEFTNEQKVTLRRLLSHSAGLSVHGFPGYAVNEPVPTLVQILNGEKPANTAAVRVEAVPGSQWKYSGGGYTLMQLMMEDVTGQPFPQLMRETVLGPLGMNNSTFEQPLPADKAKATATGYYRDRTAVEGKWHIYPEMAAAGLWTTASDLASFAINVQLALAGKSDKVLSSQMTRQMLTREQTWDSGLGVFLQGSGKTLRFGHNGRDEGFDAALIAYAEIGQGAVIMINANDNSRMVGSRILAAIAREYRWSDYPIYTRPDRPTTKVEVQALKAYTGRYEFYENYMLTFGASNGRLLTLADGMADEEFVAESDTLFHSTERDARISFVKDALGRVNGFMWKEDGKERKVPRIGPLVGSLEPQLDQDPALTRKVEAVLRAIASGGRAVEEVAGLTPGARKVFAPRSSPAFAGMRSLSFVAAEDVSGRGIKRHGGEVKRVLYYKMLTSKSARYVLVHLTVDGLVTDQDVVDK
ncbi:MAG: serine hydrolase domain-containing protein [Pyrinomonadaceae bacterium]